MADSDEIDPLDAFMAANAAALQAAEARPPKRPRAEACDEAEDGAADYLASVTTSAPDAPPPVRHSSPAGRSTRPGLRHPLQQKLLGVPA